VLFTDADCEPAQDWIEQMLLPFADAQVAGVKGTYLTHQRAVVARFVQMEYETRYERMAQHMARNGQIDFIDTYAAGYRRDVFLTSGGFDPAFATASVEDQELSFRIAQRHRLVFAPHAIVYHWGHADTLWAYAGKKFKIGYYKVDVLARHTGKAWTDSHTPQRLKAQILLLGLAGFALAAGLIWHKLAWVAAGSCLIFFLTTLPFALSAWKKDSSVALVSPGLLLLRALALGSGLLAGIVHHIGRKAARLVFR
jgi:GT2 family glycosyltransferase